MLRFKTFKHAGEKLVCAERKDEDVAWLYPSGVAGFEVNERFTAAELRAIADKLDKLNATTKR